MSQIISELAPAEATASASDSAVAQRRAHYRTPAGVVDFVREVLRAEPTAYQAEILRDFVAHRRMAVRAPHGAGKTAVSAWIVLWAVSVFDTDVKVITTASAWRQVKHFTWPEIRLWAGRANFERVGVTIRPNRELLTLQIKTTHADAFAVTSDNPAFIEGAHASVLVYVFDEAKAIPNGIWDAAEGAFSTAGSDTNNLAFALAISTPGEPSGRFYDICARKPGTEDWYTRHIRLEEAIAAGRISREWVAQRARQWGVQSAVYQNRVEGEFDVSGENNVIPLAWVERANDRWREIMENGGPKGDDISYGVDPAYKGEDKTTIARRVGRVIAAIDAHAKEDTMQTAGRVAAMVSKAHMVAVDTIGVGAGVYDRLRELHYRVMAVNVSERAADANGQPLRDSTGTQEFVNLRAFLWWMVREALDPDGDAPIALPPDDELTGDLTAPTYEYRSDGKIKVESKDDLRLRIGRSTDKADAVALSLYAARRRKLLMV